MGTSSDTTSDFVVIHRSADSDPVDGHDVDYLDKYAPVLIRGTIITTGIIGVATLARSLRMFTRFHHAREIPTDFIRRNVDLKGAVSYIRDDAVLQLLAKDADLGLVEVKLAGLEIGEAGHNWMFKNLLNKPIVFNLIRRNGDDFVSCEILAKKFFMLPRYSVNKELVRRGLARVHGWENADHLHSLRTNPAYARLVHRLVISEQVADSRGVGMWRRDSWAERVAALPSQAADMLRNTGTVRALGMTWRTARDMTQKTAQLGRSVVSTTRHVVDTSATIGRSALNVTRQVSDQARAVTSASVDAAKQVKEKSSEVAQSPVVRQIWNGAAWLTSRLWSGVKSAYSWAASQRRT